MKPLLSIFLATVVILGGTGPATATEKVAEIPVRDGVTIKTIVNADAGPQAPIVVLMMGGNGVARLDGWDGSADPNGNFLTRVRNDLARAGFIIGLPDAPSDRQNPVGLGNSRFTAGHARDIAAVIGYLRKLSKGPVFVVGTSRGTISAAGIAANLPAGEIAGIVLTAAVTQQNKKGNRDPVQAAALDRIAMPVLFVHHKQDSCYVCRPEDIPDLAKKFTASPSVKISIVDGGGGWRGDPCLSRHAHGFVGIERQVVDDIATWIKTVAAGAKP